MKKNLNLSIILVFILLIFIFFAFSKGAKSNAGVWTGDYSYTDCFTTSPEVPSYPHVPCIEYEISIKKDKKDLIAEFLIQGYQTNKHFLAKVVGNTCQIDFIFENSLEDSTLEPYEKDDLLLSFKLEKGQIYTIWEKIESETARYSNQKKGIYFEKGK